MKNSKSQLVVLKIDHRPERDKRITTHVGLTARAFGAHEFWISGVKDEKIASTIHKVNSQWGKQDFRVTTGVNWRHAVKTWKNKGGEIVHLTMYGLHVDDVITELRASHKSKLITVGGPKVPVDMFTLADYNVAVGHQPHSEVAALSIFLDRLLQGSALHQTYADAQIKIVPLAHGKQIKEAD